MKFILFIAVLLSSLHGKEYLPHSQTFLGSKRFESLTEKAITRHWHRLPIGDRMATIALELKGIPYKAYTLEIDDKVESPSVNFQGLDCWTFFETVLCFAKMLEADKKDYTKSDLLAQIEQTRYRNGQCKGSYLDRIHYLMEWYQENQKRKTIRNITKKFPHQLMTNKCNEMSKLWKHYRYLKYNPQLRAGMAIHEKRITETKFFMIPKAEVAGLEDKLKNGDIIGIARHGDGSYCSHVGLIIKDSKGKARFMHASTTFKKVVLDDTISNYLFKFKKHAGIVVARPR